MKTVSAFGLVLGLAAAVASLGATAPGPPGRDQQQLASSLAFSDRLWDESVGLLWSATPGEERRVHRVRESSWYALGLLMRDRPGDERRAVRIIEQILEFQFNTPGQPWDGTFRRAPEEPLPQPGAKVWENYDPNWRQFIGTTFALILIDFEPRLPAGLPARITDSIRRAVEGEIAQGRLTPSYTNIALMHGFLWSYAGTRLHRPEWVASGEQWAGQVHALYAPHQTFEEYNSPTYYGVDLYGLALWRKHGATENIRAFGAEMEAGLWHDLARFYHAGLRNLAGPFDRAYGMDLRHYVSLTGAWMGLVLPADLTPLPDSAGTMEHANDYICVPTYVALGARVPDDVLPALSEFQGERRLERVITPDRTATAWIGRDLMLGGELTRLTRAAGPGTRYNQFHPATAHWRVGAAEVGWFALQQCPAVDARAEPGRLTITTLPGDSVFRVAAPGLDPASFSREHWSLPNLDVRIETNATRFDVTADNGEFQVTYHAATRMVLQLVHQR